MRPYGERPKRRPGGESHWAYKNYREQQIRREPDKYMRQEMGAQDRRQQRVQARRKGKRECQSA